MSLHIHLHKTTDRKAKDAEPKYILKQDSIFPGMKGGGVKDSTQTKSETYTSEFQKEAGVKKEQKDGWKKTTESKNPEGTFVVKYLKPANDSVFAPIKELEENVKRLTKTIEVLKRQGMSTTVASGQLEEAKHELDKAKKADR